MNAFADFFTRHRLLLAIAAGCITVLATLGAMRLELDDQPRNLFHSDTADAKRLEKLFSSFGADDMDCVVVVESDDLYSSRALRAMRQIVDDAKQIAGVEDVYSIFDLLVVNDVLSARKLVPPTEASEEKRQAALREALAHPLAVGQFISPDGNTTLLVVHLAGEELEIQEIEPIVGELDEIVDSAVFGLPGIRARITGIPSLRVEIIQTLRRDQLRFFLIGTLLGILIAWALFRRIAAVAVAAVPPMVGAFWTLGLLGWAGESINVINTVLPTLVVVIGFTDAVHLVVDIRRARAAGRSQVEASADAIRHLGLACGLTSLTTSIGFASLVFAQVDVIQRFGVACAAGTLLTFCAVLTLVPLLATLVPPGKLTSRHIGPGIGEDRLWFARCIQPVLKHARVVSIIGICLTAMFFAMSLTLRPDHRITESVPRGNESALALEHADEAFGGVLFSYVLITWPEDASAMSDRTIDVIHNVHSKIRETEGLCNPISLYNFFQATPAALDSRAVRMSVLALIPDDLQRRFLLPEERHAIVVAHLRDVGVAANRTSFEDLNERLTELRSAYPEYAIELTGTSVLAARNIDLMISDLARSLGIAAVIIFFVLSAAFRSLRIGLISIVPNVFPLVMTAGGLALAGQPLQITSVIVFSVCLGIAVDDTIHVITRFKREMPADPDVPRALERTFVKVGIALFTTTTVLIAGFGTLMFSEVPAIYLFSLLSCIAVTAAFVGDLFLLPAMLKTFVDGDPWAMQDDAALIDHSEESLSSP